MKANTIIRRFGRFAACVAMLAAAACTGNFEDYNTKPFRPSDDDLNGDNVGVGILGCHLDHEFSGIVIVEADISDVISLCIGDCIADCITV